MIDKSIVVALAVAVAVAVLVYAVVRRLSGRTADPELDGSPRERRYPTPRGVPQRRQ
jgi:hypothetical protein